MSFVSLRAMVAPRKGAAVPPVRFEVRRDEDAGVWYAIATDACGIVTEAETLDGLRERLAQLVPDFLERNGECPIELEFCDDTAEEAKA